MPYRGKTNTPAYVPHVAQKLAELKGVDIDAIATATRTNTLALFRGMAAA